MSNEKVLMNKDDLVSLADSIRSKSGSTDEMTVIQMKTAVDRISSGMDGQFFPLIASNYFKPTITLTYNGEEI